ncbi:MAG: PilZ domain-containing protein [Rhodanobacter sp.]
MTEPARMSRRRPVDVKRAAFITVVTDTTSGLPIGHLGNLSNNGILLICPHAPHRGALYQLSLTLPGAERRLMRVKPIELGVREQWQRRVASTNQVWARYQIIAISDADAARIESWLAQD